ncbi:high mobility group A5 [Raphanus sativus]|nr:high mobility group A5 [Raphanus sativus]
MDPSLPPQFTAFPPFNNSNPYAPPQHPLYGSTFFQPSPPVPSHPSVIHPHYSEMICSAISALNEAEGSSKQAISRYIERFYTGIPPAHGALLTHHLRTLKNRGVLVMVKKSYKLAASAPPPTSAAAAALEPPRSDFNNRVNDTQQQLPPPPTSAPPQTQKRGRGRPPKAKPTADVQTNGISTFGQIELPVPRPEEQQMQLQLQASPPQPQPSKRPPGRPRKDGASPTPTVKAAAPVVSGGEEIAKRRGRPPSGRAAGRQRKPALVSAPASVFPYVANGGGGGGGGVRRRGRPKRIDAGASSVALAPPNAVGGGGELVAKRGRGRPPKIGGVIRKAMKPKRGYSRTGRPVGRPRKNAASKGASGQQDISYGELKNKFELFQEKAKEIVNVLKAEVGGSYNQAVVQAIHDLEELTVTKREATEEPRHVQPDEHHFENEPQPEGHGYGQVQTETEAMQEALF